MKKRLVVLISGNGSNLQAILEACDEGRLPATVAAVISNRPAAYGLERARRAAVPALLALPLAGESRREYDARLASQVAAYQPDYVVLAGWMRLLTSDFLTVFPRQVINLHPALPGAFPGTRAIERAYAAWQDGQIDRSGVMVHLVPDEGVDDGPLLASQEIFFHPGETLEQFEARLHQVEHRLLVETLQKVLLAT